MECNKEEAIRAKEIAEKKMQNKDFVGARKIILRAQQLFPDLENISQILTICEVHCSAEHKLLGSEMNWYGILQIEQMADEASIKKQYRKLALILHPDKNKFAGAEAAFKLIGEGHGVLSDQEKRLKYDMKHGANLRSSQIRNSNVRKQPGVDNNFVNVSRTQFTSVNPHLHQQKQQKQPGLFNGQQTFWTECPFCNIKYQYYKDDVLNKALRCQKCMKSFIAYDLDVQCVRRSTIPQQKEVLSQGGQKFASQSTVGSFPSHMFHGNFGYGATTSDPLPRTGDTNEVGKGYRMKEEASRGANSKDGTKGKKKPKLEAEKCNTSKKRKKKKFVVESSDSCDDTGSNTDAEEDEIIEDLSDENPFLRRLKRSRGTGLYNVTEDQNPNEESLPNGNDEAEGCKKNRKEASMEDIKGRPEVDNKLKPNSGSKTKPDPEFFNIPDPDFCDFDKDRKEECFEVDQMWALYDSLDGMPRFYARIKKVFSPGFKVLIIWLEANPDDEDKIHWFREDLPIACGKFRHGTSEITKELGMFSHVISWEKGFSRSSYRIYPKKGETWALFKNWDMEWSSDPENHRNFEFEFVEVVSDYDEGSGTSVTYLVRVKGFVSLFNPKKGTIPFQIPPNELLRFSHRVPSYKTKGTEREDVPEGYFELDPASLPDNLKLSEFGDLKA